MKKNPYKVYEVCVFIYALLMMAGLLVFSAYVFADENTPGAASSVAAKPKKTGAGIEGVGPEPVAPRTYVFCDQSSKPRVQVVAVCSAN